ncbi:MAG: ATPase, T2SS/T4P/T4SS family [Candidatus Omnitrophota bacterium]|jgi:type IV pilus assembly protein PilB
MQTLKDTIIDVLIKGKHLTQEQLEKAVLIQKQKHVSLRRVLVENGFISEENLLSLLSTQLYIPTIHLAKYKVDVEIIKLIPEHIARQYNVIPLSQIGRTLTVAISDPLNIFALDDLKALTGFNIDIVLSPYDEIIKAIETHYAAETNSMNQLLQDDSYAAGSTEKQSIEVMKEENIEISGALQESEKPFIVKLVDLMITEALKRRASDIHIEPDDQGLRIRFRIDGALHEMFDIPKSKQNAVIARIKIISELDITENRIPQDGRFKIRYEGKEIDFRVSGLPVSGGQKFVLRILDKGTLSIGLEKLGFSQAPHDVFKAAIAKPFGMILVTGPTGSGKSTTLYSVLTQLNTPERNIITVEDPVEYQVGGVTQIQVKADIGLTFATGLRALLRQSPDIIMIGEIRDSETADIAVKASLTGQLVLSTLHTNDAITSITRLVDMGIEPFLVGSSLIMVCAQRLCRRICSKCKQPITLPKDYLESIGFIHSEAKGKHKKDASGAADLSKEVIFYKAVGCSYCNNTGFRGRIAILEALLINDFLREMIIKKKSIDEIKAYAIEKCGMKTLRDDAFVKVREGLTTFEEALRITTEE